MPADEYPMEEGERNIWDEPTAAQQARESGYKAALKRAYKRLAKWCTFTKRQNED